MGAFGGTYFRDIEIDGVWYRDAWSEFAQATDWFDGLDIPTAVSNATYVPSRNRYGVKCGQSLDVWLEKGWIEPEVDSHGWVHWYCRFFLGRRVADDARQIARWARCAGETGRWRRNLIAKCVRAGRPFDDERVSPVVRFVFASVSHAFLRAFGWLLCATGRGRAFFVGFWAGSFSLCQSAMADFVLRRVCSCYVVLLGRRCCTGRIN